VTRLLLITAVLAAVLLGCSSGTDTGSKAGGGGSGGGGGPSLPTIEVTATDFAFSPTTITAKAGTVVKVRVANKGSVSHNFTIKALGIDNDIAPGTTATIQVKVPASAQPFYCRFHDTRGMTGSLTIG